MNNLSYLGSSVKFPVQLQRGKVTTVSGTENVRQSIMRLISTPKGSVFFNRAYGCDIEKMLFEVNDDLAVSMIRHFIQEAIKNFEPRVQFQSMTYKTEGAALMIEVKYRILAINEIDSLVYPFYRKISV